MNLNFRRRTLRCWLVMLLALAPAGLASQGSVPAYLVGPSDVISIAVFGQPQLSGKYPVEADGTFTFPLVGRVTVGGRTLRAIEQDLRSRLGGTYLNDPQVSVTVDEYRSQRVFVMGEVRQPGGVPITGRLTLLEALARAGSPTEHAGDDAWIMPGVVEGGGTAGPRALDTAGTGAVRVNLRQLQSGALAQNVVLQPGDTVFVPRVETFFVSGNVRSSGEFVMRAGMTVRQAVILAGGVTERGSLGRAQLIRQAGGAEVKTSARPGDLVRPGDTVYVRERWF